MKVFIGFGDKGSLSHRTGELLKDFIEGLFTNQIECFVASRDVGAGTSWRDALMQSIGESDWGILCVTAESRDRPWLLFEAGALTRKTSENGSGPRVCPLVIDFSAGSLIGPLATLQAKQLASANEANSRSEIKSLAIDLNDFQSERLLTENVFQRQFEAFWSIFWRNFLIVVENSRQADPAVESPPPPDNSELMTAIRTGFRELLKAVSPTDAISKAISCPYCRALQSVEIRPGNGRTKIHQCENCNGSFNLHNIQNERIIVRPIFSDNVLGMVKSVVTCPCCGDSIHAEMPDRSGETRRLTCLNCDTSVDVHLGSDGTIFVGGSVDQHDVSGTPDDQIRRILRKWNSWVEPSKIQQLTNLLLETEHFFCLGKNNLLTATDLTKLAIERHNSSPNTGNRITNRDIRNFVKLCVHGGGFHSSDGDSVGFGVSHVIPSEGDLTRAFVVALLQILKRAGLISLGVKAELVALFRDQVSSAFIATLEQSLTEIAENQGEEGLVEAGFARKSIDDPPL